MSRLLLTCFLSIGSTAVGCDSPSGGKGRIDCAQFPQSPSCQGGTTADPDATTGGTDAIGGDDADDTQPTEQDATTTTSPPADTSVGEDSRVCDEGDYQCAAGRSEVCLGGAWELDDLCDDNERCGSDGRCECVPACGPRACGDDGCGGDCGGCEPDEECNAQGQCVETTVTCAAIQQCFASQCASACTNPSSVGCANCITICKAGATGEIKARWDDMQDCFACTSYDCLRDCTGDIGWCMFERNGIDSCVEILQCGSACGASQACVQDCFEEGTITGQGAAMLLNGCVNQVCGSDSGCAQGAIAEGGQCEGYGQICFDD